MVRDEITSSDDDLSDWVKKCKIPIRKIDEQVILCLRKIYQADESHKRLVDSTRGRSLADPWVIAHAMHESAIVVTKENLARNTNRRPKIPNVCQNLGVPCINDSKFVTEIGISFKCELYKK